MTPETMRAFRGSIEEQHPTWPETVTWLRGGQSNECRSLKEQLVEIEEIVGSGRVRLSDFYRAAIHGGKWQFSETISYLRQLGAIDDSSPDEPRIMIPNYITSPTNCLASSTFYAVCCLDECEELLGHLERSVGAPSAGADELLRL